MRVHLEVGDRGGEVEGFAEVLQRHVEGNVDEVLLGRVDGTGEVEEGVDAEGGELSLGAGVGDGLGGLEVGAGGLGGGLGAGDKEEGGGDGGGENESSGDEGD